jgi:hypothetical protein
MRYRQWLPSCLSIVLLGLSLSVQSAVNTTAEYKLKAALLYKLTRFIEWPPRDGTAASRFGICVLGRDDFGQSLDELSVRKVGEASIVIHRFKNSGSIGASCQLVFISDSKRAFLGKILRRLKKKPMLTVSDSEGFAVHGGMVQMSLADKRITFKINHRAAKMAGLKISSKLLNIATIVDSE